jgi:predicted RNA-binding Zn-ribbon protein involved in translation (DUF1610 family)
MKICAMCGKKVKIDEYFKRTSSCPNCGEDLHICLNCRHYSESSRHWCLEPRVELPRARDKANFCDFFRYREGGQKPSGASENKTDDAKKNFEDLFK